ncbi:hypothetical protein OGAPHI_005634 [Ogataea philodendri]|uniref:Uncharacterized protein n=1 Tax=Ogataea philodendri TaxID=1378263 RepID=A0A9P8P035_9ASCO|nr:uncharacterized protein OGAPHI_005634 [Ogataea philodendri]KAH3662382.1 hypothetical protein OGAPHI_005634 [Ogataea philodendri]
MTREMTMKSRSGCNKQLTTFETSPKVKGSKIKDLTNSAFTFESILSWGFGDCMRQQSGTLGLGLTTHNTQTVCRTAVAFLWLGTVSVDVVIKSDLFAFENFAFGKDAHTEPFIHHPFLHKCVWIARVVAKPPNTGLLSGVDDLVILDHHEVEVFDALVGVFLFVLFVQLVIDDLSLILHNECLCWNIFVGSHTEPFMLSFEDRDWSDLVLLKTLVLTIVSAGLALSINTFDICQSVDTVRVRATRVILTVRANVLGTVTSHKLVSC